MLNDGPGQEDHVVAPRAHRATGEQTGGQLGPAPGAAPVELDEGPAVGDVPIDRQDRPRYGLYVNDVIVVTAVLVGVLERSPPGGKGETAVVADEIAEIGHGVKHSMPPELSGWSPGPMSVRWHDDPVAL